MPRNISYQLIKIEHINYPTNKPVFRIPILVLKATMIDRDQFKLKTGCKEYYLSELVNYKNPSFLNKKEYAKNYEEKINIAKDKDGKPIKLDKEIIQDQDQDKDLSQKIKKRCPNGTRRNKISGLCESITKTKIKRKTSDKKKLPRCPNGTRRNKKNGNCEAN